MTFERIYDEWSDEYDLMYARDDDGGVSEHTNLFNRVLLPVVESGTALEVGCGTGQVVAALSKMNFDVTGIDISDRSLDHAKNRAQALGIEAKFLKADILESTFDSGFDVITAMSSFITHFLTEDEQIACLKSIKNLLNPEGVVIFSIYNYGLLLEREADDAVHYVTPISRGEKTGVYFQRRRWSGSPRSLLHDCSYYTILDDQTDPVIAHMTRLGIKPSRLTELLREIGFADIRWYAPSECGYYQDVCVASLKENALSPNTSGTSDIRRKCEVVVIWDGSKELIPVLKEYGDKYRSSLSLIHTKIIDSPRSADETDLSVDEVNQIIEDIQTSSGEFPFLGTSIQRLLDSVAPDWLTLAYFGAQAALTMNTGPGQKIVFLLSKTSLASQPDTTSEQMTKECREMLKIIMRTEEIPQVNIITDARQNAQGNMK